MGYSSITTFLSLTGDLLDANPVADRPSNGLPSNGMFSGMDFSGQAAPAATQSAEVDFFGGSQAPSGQRGDREAVEGSDPFGSLQSGPSPPQTAEPLADIFGGLSFGQSQSVPPKSPIDLLGGLNSTPANTQSSTSRGKREGYT